MKSPTTERTIKRDMKELAPEIEREINAMMHEFASVDSWILEALHSKDLRHYATRGRDFRNRLVRYLNLEEKDFQVTIDKLASSHKYPLLILLKHLWHIKTDKTEPHLQARHWKLALEDAVRITGTHWKNLCEYSKKKIARKAWYTKLTAEGRNYALWLLDGADRQFFAMLNGAIPNACYDGYLKLGFSEKEARKAKCIPLEKESRKAICLRISSFVSGKASERVRYPHIKCKADVIDFDVSCYQFRKAGVGEECDTVELMSRTRGARIALQIKGRSFVKGRLRLKKFDDGRYRIYFYAPIECEPLREVGAIRGYDLGYTEVFTCDNGRQYGTNLGEKTSAYSDAQSEKEVNRQRQYEHKKKLQKSSKPSDRKKAENIGKYNLGRKKIGRQLRKAQETIKSTINHALNEIMQEADEADGEKVKEIVIEKLSGKFPFKYSKKMNRRLTRWMRRYIRERLYYKARIFGVKVTEVPACYTSVTCPGCGCIDKANRSGDKFECVHCGKTGHADQFAAMNIKARRNDPEIHLGMPRQGIKKILEKRFNGKSLLEGGSSE